VQETTSAAGDRRGSANPTWSKTRQRAFEGGPPELAGRSHEGVGNGAPRWMVANRVVARRHGEQNPAYEPAHPHSPRRRAVGITALRSSPGTFGPWFVASSPVASPVKAPPRTPAESMNLRP